MVRDHNRKLSLQAALPTQLSIVSRPVNMYSGENPRGIPLGAPGMHNLCSYQSPSKKLLAMLCLLVSLQ